MALVFAAIVGVAGARAARAEGTEPDQGGAHVNHAAHEESTMPEEHAPQGVAAGDPDPMARMEGMEPRAEWTAMIHGWAFANYNDQGGPSGDDSFESQNHVMTMAMRSWLGGKLSLFGTFALEPATIPAKGSPQLFQRGETYQGNLLVDRQHPHDLFVQLAASWERKAWDTLHLRFYLAPVGEPAVGPTAFVHRLSASENPTAPLGHHNQDSTHISADVVSAGATLGILTVEGSLFHGREPDDDRWGIEQGALDSYSGRVWVRPIQGLAIQVSAARREEPEELEPGNQTRQTASVEYRRATAGGFIAAAIISGRNLLPGDGVEWGHTLEATWRFARANNLYARVERVDRDLFELRNKRQRPEDVPAERTAVEAATLGYVRDFATWNGLDAGVGGDVTAYQFTERLDDVYDDNPISYHVFLRLRFEWHSGMSGHEHDSMESMEHTGH
jgi:hypothetical protein